MADFFTKRSDGSEASIVDTSTEISYEQDLGFPGSYPFTRGVQPSMYRGRFWTMRQYSGFGTAEQTNERFHMLLKAGQTGLSTAFDLPTQMGFDADDSMAQGEVGRVGVSISSIDDMERLFHNISLDQVSTSMTINSTASILLAFYVAVAEKHGVSKDKLRGTLQNDILKEYIARGTYIYPPAPSIRLVTDIIEYCATDIPKWNPISISGYHIREAGSDAIQEVGFTLSNAIAYAENAIKRGLNFDQFAGQLSFFFNCHNDFIEEISKFRAARKLWAEIATQKFQAKHDRSKLLRFHTQTAGSTLTAQQPDNNIIRVTIQALAAVMGGTQSLHTNSRDEALGLPTDQSAMIALRTQQIIADESGATNTIDPLAGSYTIEKETQRIFDGAKKIIQEVTSMGGSVQAIEEKYFQNAIAERAYEYQQEIERKERKIVGVNAYTTENLKAPDVLKLNPQLEIDQRARLKKFRESRDMKATQTALQKLENASRGKENLIPFIIEAAKANATLGEVATTLKKEFGIYQP
ncbi:MAG: methylmalonyl-CoA mutase [Proteobacteria bacterium]|jgi:methylmalonyl-CoA mutase N-terminal domain/subunit|nr:methylmalonyl-CoA mutase [Pseudomonadota bacterium]